MATVAFGRKDRVRELQKFISSKYVGVAFNLPPACGTFWGLMREEIHGAECQDPHAFTNDVSEVLAFLTEFFSPDLVERIHSNMIALEKSFLGIDYTLRRGKGMIAKAILNDVELECGSKGSPLHDFLGHVDLPYGGYHASPHDGDVDGGGGWQKQGRETARDSSSGSRSLGLGRGRSDIAFRGGGSGARRGGGRGDRHGSATSMHFITMDRDTILISMSWFASLPFGDLDSGESLKSRSRAFVSHGLVEGHHAQMYDPHVCELGTVSLFHGTRTQSLVSFQQRGILPRYNRNEFSLDEAFYVCSSVQQAYEHPLHYHPSQTHNVAMSVLVFEVDVGVLHGLKPPRGKTFTFTNVWFRDVEEDLLLWQTFCKDNFMERGTPHGCDIVIGPICLPRDDGSRYDKLSVSLPGNAPLTQVAFCSRRSRAWLEECFKRVYSEQRGAS